MSNNFLFSDELGVYRLVDYNPSHSELLFRKHKFQNPNKNIDVLFKGVYSINIQILYKGLRIFREVREKDQTCSNMADRTYIFRLADIAGVNSYIDAAVFGVFENELEHNESSIGAFTWSQENKLIFWSDDNSKGGLSL